MTEQPAPSAHCTSQPGGGTAGLASAGPADRLRSRYGRPVGWQPPEWNDTLDLMLRHRSTRRYLDKHVPEETLRTVIAAAQSAPTSSNQQIISALAIRDQAKKDAVAEIGAPSRSTSSMRRSW